jgi:predicted dehydrogenase
MAYEHGAAYQSIDGCELVACADIVEENARAFADAHGFSSIYKDYKEMFEKERLDVVSICTWPHLHEPMALDAMDAGVKVIHCEKPMADTWRGACKMARTAQEKGVQLTFNHQRRYGKPFTLAKDLIDNGEIGDLLRFECEFGNIYDTGTHFIDMLSFYLGDSAKGQWVLAQVDAREKNQVFGAYCEDQQLLLFEYDNGVFGLVYGGKPGGKSPLGVTNRIIGTEGIIDVGVGHGADNAIRWRKLGEREWRHPDTGGESIHGPHFIQRAIQDVIDCYRAGRKCQLSAENALVATEIIFGAYESSRTRGRVDFPLSESVGNPLRDLVEGG